LPVTTVYVTHDQVEALTLGDRVAVFNDGRLLQIGEPTHLYDAPATLFVAEFIGSPRINLFPGRLVSTDRGGFTLHALDQSIPLTHRRLREGTPPLSEVTSGIRPQDLHWTSDAPARCSVHVPVVVDLIENTGAELFVTSSGTATSRLVARLHRSASVAVGDKITLAFDPADLHLFAHDTGRRLLESEPQSAHNDSNGDLVETLERRM
jgi:multiple sugar transport system ATP-binding protein